MLDLYLIPMYLHYWIIATFAFTLIYRGIYTMGAGWTALTHIGSEGKKKNVLCCLLLFKQTNKEGVLYIFVRAFSTAALCYNYLPNGMLPRAVHQTVGIIGSKQDVIYIELLVVLYIVGITHVSTFQHPHDNFFYTFKLTMEVEYM